MMILVFSDGLLRTVEKTDTILYFRRGNTTLTNRPILISSGAVGTVPFLPYRGSTDQELLTPTLEWSAADRDLRDPSQPLTTASSRRSLSDRNHVSPPNLVYRRQPMQRRSICPAMSLQKHRLSHSSRVHCHRDPVSLSLPSCLASL